MFIKILMCLMLILTSGCASIVSQSVYPVHIDSLPEKTNFVVYNRNDIEVKRGHTPTIVYLESGAGFFVPATYHIRFFGQKGSISDVLLKSHIDGWYFGNLFSSILGLILVDPATGAMWELPDRVTAHISDTQKKCNCPEKNRLDITY